MNEVYILRSDRCEVDIERTFRCVETDFTETQLVSKCYEIQMVEIDFVETQ